MMHPSSVTINDRNSPLGEMTRIIKTVNANGLPIAEGKSYILINTLITVD
jgi:hypothetical protein